MKQSSQGFSFEVQGSIPWVDLQDWIDTKLSGKTDPSEIGRTYNIRKQQTQFY